MNHDGACQPVLNTQQSVAFEYDDHFEQLLDELGIREVIGDDDEALRTMWNNLKVIDLLDKKNQYLWLISLTNRLTPLKVCPNNYFTNSYDK